MKKLVLASLIIVSFGAHAFCNFNDNNCRQGEEMIELQKQQIEQNRQFQQQQIRIQAQEQANSGPSGTFRTCKNGRCW